MEEIGYFDLQNLRLREEPRREPCFRMVRYDTEMEQYPRTTPEGLRETLHRHMTNEITSLDIAAQCLVDFVDAPWELRMELARQCWDETRHVRVLWRRLRELGGHKGEFPISAFEWCVTSAIDNIAGRLATQNRTFEAGAMDVVGSLIREVREFDATTADILEGILADEVQHVRFANRWIKRMAEQDKRTLLKVASAIRFLATANQALQAKEGELDATGQSYSAPSDRVAPVNVEDRRIAEFTDAEIEEILRQAGFRSLLSDSQEAVRS